MSEDNNLVINIEELTLNNNFYRRVISTSNYSQVVLMSIEPHNEIGMEIHKNNDQFIRIEQGSGYAQLQSEVFPIYDGISIHVPAGTYHNIVNESDSEMKLYTIYSPPLHNENLIT